MTILVTGATGFIGSHLCRALVERGERVRAFHRLNSSLVGLEGLAVEHALGDLTQPETLAAAMQGVEVVFHTAARVGRKDRGDMQAVTVAGTRSLLGAAHAAGVRRVVHTSSVAALGVPEAAGIAHHPPMLMDERHTWNYRPEWWPYGFAKYQAESEVQNAIARGLDVVIVNPAVVVGAGDLNRISGDVVVRVARGQLPVSVAGGLNVVHIRDVVRGHLAALERGRTGERYILGGENLPIPRFQKLIAEVSGGRPPLFQAPTQLARALAGPVGFLKTLAPLPIGGELLRLAGLYFYYDTRKAREELGLGGLRPAREAVEEAYQWYYTQGMT